MTSNDKNLWRASWLGCINQLTSLELQKKSWNDRTHSNPHWSFVEFICCYFDDLVIHENYKYQLDNDWVTQKEYDLIEDWHTALAKYNPPKNDHFDNEAILNDPKWLEIIEIGVAAQNNLASILNDTERKLLTEETDYLKFI
ncbi:hypothetical protein [Chryseobacterium sp.]|uniref:hypothetical protein n=1 Tax=Chryseobacterium sp. TaxID=1871047 RepID=UPI0011C9D855|nr:hypothetical protein [Chryseobacterium sp.]TXF79220.1 hypothetical protein FUA25_02160 [Chryseobacterium sp.]